MRGGIKGEAAYLVLIDGVPVAHFQEVSHDDAVMWARDLGAMFVPPPENPEPGVLYPDAVFTDKEDDDE